VEKARKAVRDHAARDAKWLRAVCSYERRWESGTPCPGLTSTVGIITWITSACRIACATEHMVLKGCVSCETSSAPLLLCGFPIEGSKFFHPPRKCKDCIRTAEGIIPPRDRTGSLQGAADIVFRHGEAPSVKRSGIQIPKSRVLHFPLITPIFSVLLKKFATENTGECFYPRNPFFPTALLPGRSRPQRFRPEFSARPRSQHQPFRRFQVRYILPVTLFP
jgi:hypothetical protein